MTVRIGAAMRGDEQHHTIGEVATIEIEQRSRLTQEQAWVCVTNWAAHAQTIPLTSIVVEPAVGAGVGTVFTARTGIGWLGFDDPMQVTSWQPPPAPVAFCRLEKRGRLVTGWAEIEVHTAGNESRTLWREDIVIAHLPRIVDPIVRLVSRCLFGRTLRRLLAT